MNSSAQDELPRLTAAHTTLWGYDPSGRVVQEQVKGITSSFLMDGGGRRFRRVTDTGRTVYTVYGFNGEPLMVLEKTSPTAALIWKQSSVFGFGTLISEEKPSGTFWVQGDQVGSPNIITNAEGAVVGRSKNLPFGERFGSTGQTSARRYTNHEDQEGSAIYMQARTYLPAYGKFAQVDPAYDQMKDDPESWNLYNYVTNNPVTHTDPDGRESAETANPDPNPATPATTAAPDAATLAPTTPATPAAPKPPEPATPKTQTPSSEKPKLAPNQEGLGKINKGWERRVNAVRAGAIFIYKTYGSQLKNNEFGFKLVQKDGLYFIGSIIMGPPKAQDGSAWNSPGLDFHTHTEGSPAFMARQRDAIVREFGGTGNVYSDAMHPSGSD